MQSRKLCLVNAGLGMWVVVSSAFWQVGTANSTNMLVTGLIVVVTALLAIRMPSLRLVNTAAGVWLIASLFAFPGYSSPAVWNNVMVGAAIALVSLVGPAEANMLSS